MHPDDIPDINDSETISDQPKQKSPAQLLAERINASIPVAPVPAVPTPPLNPPLMDEALHKLHEELKRCNQLRLEAEVGAQREKQKSKQSLDMISQLNKEVTLLKRENYNLKASPPPAQVVFQSPDAATIERLEERLANEAGEHKNQLRSYEGMVSKLTIAVCLFAAVAGSLGCLAWKWRPSRSPAAVAPVIDSGSRDQPVQPKSPRRIIDITPKEESTEFRVISDEPQK